MADIAPDKDINAQIDELRNQIDKLSTDLARRIDTASEHADEALSFAKTKVSAVANQAREEGRNVVRTAKENPTATSSILLGTALVGFVAGLLVSRLND